MSWLVYKHISPSHKVYISIKEHRFVNEGNGYLEAKLK